MAIVINNHHGFKPFARAKRCKLPSFTQADFAHSAKQANFHRSFSTPCFSLANKGDDDPNASPRVEIVGGFRASGVRALVVEAAIAMSSGVDPILVPSGLGGAYYLSSLNGDSIAVVKPIDEEPLALNNPKGYAGLIVGQPGLKRSVRVGENGVREVAAYLIDHSGFAGVPPTALVKISSVAFHVNNQTGTMPLPKIASIQRFVDHDFDAGDLGMSGFSVSSVHRIGILDIRLLNLDRHAGNILVKKKRHEKSTKSSGSSSGCASERYAIGAAELVPIDHGLCLPELLDDPYFEWLHWPQAAVPFSESEAEYICQLDPLKDAELLRTELPSLRESAIRVLMLCTVFLKCAVAAGLCLADIGEMMTREHYGMEQAPSVLETLCSKAKASMNNNILFEDDEDEEESEQENDILQFDIESEDSCSGQKASEMSKPLKSPMRFPSVPSASGLLAHELLFPLHEGDGDEESDEIGDGDQRVVGGLTRSMSVCETKHNHESGGVSLGEMSKDEWVLFLEQFERLLPKVFEVRKTMGLKQRLGTSCKF